MNKNSKEGKASSPDIDPSELLMNLRSDDGTIREEARHKLVSMGDKAIDILAGYVTSEDDLLRWEVVKTLSEIHKPVTAPLLVEAMEDDMISIRWMAAEGIIGMKDEALVPLLEKLAENGSSARLIESAHHVFHTLKKQYDNESFREMFSVLDDRDSHEKIPLIAQEILDKME